MFDYVLPTLLEMPEIVMNQIFSYLDVKSIFKMQKVCHQLYNFVEDQKPDIRLTSIELKATTYGFTCFISSELSGNIQLKYLKTAMACPRMREHGILLEHDYPMPIFFEDIGRLLDFQKSPLRELELVLKYKKYDSEYGQMLGFVENLLKNRSKKLRTQWLWMSALDQSHVMQILPNIDFCGIGRITVADAVVDYDKDVDQEMEIDEILGLKQFNEFEKLDITKFLVDSEDYEENVVEKFLDISEVYLKLKKITIEDLKMIRNLEEMSDYVPHTLLEMPEIVMDHIFSYLDVKSIFKMQKVCLQLHNFVSERKPDIRLTSLELQATTYGFICKISSERSGKILIMYLKTGMACPRMRENGILLEHDHPMPVFFKDIGRLLDFQKSPLRELDLVLECKQFDSEYGQMLEFVKNTLQNQSKKLKTQWLWMSALDESHVMQILPNIELCGIRRFTLSNAVVDYDRDVDQKMGSDEILELNFNDIEKMVATEFLVDSKDFKRKFSGQDVGDSRSVFKIEKDNNPGFGDDSRD
ncbi:hypothetical protein B9Z55_021303 [Caenorhabditis nigoni]|uniref:F-box domain-containing protein n=1 Tax=Caenorhabditis nigoni TaxID=1611254 RepID=A0A2G5TRJ8_9PELO|nr:hypothetical protein B9Z55_021303 [Caenorhabditis nigoni]